MPSERKQHLVKDLIDQLSNASGVIFVNHHGMNTQQIEELRNLVEETGASYRVAKNTLLRVALAQSTTVVDDTTLQQLGDTLSGPTATLFISDNIIDPIKKLVEFIQNHDRPVIKHGVIEKKLYDPEQINALSKIPPRDILLAQLLGQINAPARNLAYVLNASISNLVYVLDAIRVTKEKNPQTPKGGDGRGEN